MTNLAEGILAVLIERVKQIDERATEDAIELYALRRVLKSSLLDFDARYGTARAAVEQARATPDPQEPGPVYDDLIRKLKGV
jgi:hypothetical protein